MEYNSVTFVAYFSAAVVACLLTGTYLFQLLRGQKTCVFLWAAALHTIHLDEAPPAGAPLSCGLDAQPDGAMNTPRDSRIDAHGRRARLGGCRPAGPLQLD